MNIAIGIIGALLIGYLLGSISSGVLIGKVFFGVDVRTQGSHNSGGTNTGRVLGKKVGLITILLDMLKTILSIWIVLFIVRIDAVQTYLELDASYYGYIAGIGACVGHIFPLYFGFKGGKVVSCFAGIVVATNWIFSIGGIIFFFIVLKLTKYVSVSSIAASMLLAILAFFPVISSPGMIFGQTNDIYYGILMLAAALILLLRHHQNIKRLINGTENKVKWL